MGERARRGPGGRAAGPEGARRRGRGRARGARPAPATRAAAPPAGDPRPAPAPPTLAGRLRRFGLTIAAVDGVAVLLIATIALIGVTVADAGITPLPATVATLWMLLMMSPVVLDDAVLGLVPALPGMALVALAAWRIRREVAGPVSVRDIRVLAAVALGAPAALTAVAWLMLLDAGKVLPVAPPNLFRALAGALLLRLVALAAGLGPRLLTALLRRRSLPEWPVASLRLAADLLGWLWGAGALAVLVAMAWHHAAVAEAYRITAGAGGIAGLTALSAAYLPNIAVGGLAVLVGAPATIGVAEAGLFAVIPGSLPPLPPLAAMPQSAHPAAPLLLVVVPAVVVWRTRRMLRRDRPGAPYPVAVGAAAAAGAGAAALAWLTGGILGQYGHSGAVPGMTGILVSAWVALPAAVVVLAESGWPPSRPGDPGRAAADDAAEGDEADAGAPGAGAGEDAADDAAEGGDADAGAPGVGAGEDAADPVADPDGADGAAADAAADADVGAAESAAPVADAGAGAATRTADAPDPMAGEDRDGAGDGGAGEVAEPAEGPDPAAHEDPSGPSGR
ncbi:cell division protein PerM [Corynebacterium sphenisci]|uniref:cell division protein PerM n=1 Tax=Corynebacterium sphenisci TaxID=191493 RepID=UPI0026DEE5CD|nr:DUF6350 family protein [Corynebacterium sphenisci]MDO5730741.1 DUF6350 family protein [Corynebacterium sphenisci]